MARTLRNTPYRKERQLEYNRIRNRADRRTPVFDEDLSYFLNEEGENAQIIEHYSQNLDTEVVQ